MLKNITELLVTQRLNDVLRKVHYEGCTCERCKEDMAAYALNRLPSRYVSTLEGEVIARTAEMDTEFEFHILRALAEAIKVVGEHPHHRRSGPVSEGYTNM